MREAVPVTKEPQIGRKKYGDEPNAFESGAIWRDLYAEPLDADSSGCGCRRDFVVEEAEKIPRELEGCGCERLPVPLSKPPREHRASGDCRSDRQYDSTGCQLRGPESRRSDSTQPKHQRQSYGHRPANCPWRISASVTEDDTAECEEGSEGCQMTEDIEPPPRMRVEGGNKTPLE